jgi:hypothetical protein
MNWKRLRAQSRMRIFGPKFEQGISAEQAHATFDTEVALVVVVLALGPGYLSRK